MSGWSGANETTYAAFEAAANAVVELVRTIDDGWDRPGLGAWDLQALVGHTSRSLLTVIGYLDRPAEALEQWHLALPEGVVDTATLWWEIGQAHERAGDLDEAQAAYEQMLATGDIDAHHALGELALLRGDEASARRHFADGAGAGDDDAAVALANLLPGK